MADIADLIFELRQLAESFRDARSHLGEQSFSLWLNLRRDGNNILREIWDLGFLRSIDAVRAVDRELKRSIDGALMPSNFHLFLFDNLVGFSLPYLEADKNDPVLFYITPGVIQQRSILIAPEKGDNWVTDDHIVLDAIWDRHGFELLGRCMGGCEKIIEIIEREIEFQQVDHADDGNRDDVLADGLSTDKRIFRWHGKTYTLGLVPSKVVELLHNRYLDGEYFVHEQFIKTECDVGSDMRHIVRDNHLEDLIVRQKKPNGKTTNGMWGLNPN